MTTQIQQGVSETEADMVARLGSPPTTKAAKSVSLTEYRKMMAKIESNVPPKPPAKFDPLAASRDIGKRQLEEEKEEKVRKKEARKQMWSNFKSGLASSVRSVFERYPCPDWRKYGTNYDRKYMYDLGPEAINYGSEYDEFHEATARVLLHDARGEAARDGEYRSTSSPEYRCARVIYDAWRLVNGNKDWFYRNCTRERFRRYGYENALIPEEIRQARGSMWGGFGMDNPLAEQDELRRQLDSDLSRSFSIDIGPVLDRVCQLCQEDEQRGNLSFGKTLGAEMLASSVGVDYDTARADMMDAQSVRDPWAGVF
jgi:hypothetical protein